VEFCWIIWLFGAYFFWGTTVPFSTVTELVQIPPVTHYHSNFFSFFIFFFCWIHVAKQALCQFSHNSNPFCSGYFGDRISGTICLNWPWTVVLLTSASHLARIICKPSVSNYSKCLIKSMRHTKEWNRGSKNWEVRNMLQFTEKRINTTARQDSLAFVM
jgi:hypothetical protein